MIGAVPFKEAKDIKTLTKRANILAVTLIVLLTLMAYLRYQTSFRYGLRWIMLLSLLPIMCIHEFLHAICFKKDVYLYTSLRNGMFFVIGTETMSKARFVFMSMLPNLVLGIIPYCISMLMPQYQFLLGFSIILICTGSGDYMNVFNAIFQMPKVSRTYMNKFNSYWYMPNNGL